MELERLAQALGPVEVVNPAAADVRELAYDARRVEPGALFFCVRGAQADGHEFAAEAVANGAAALVVEHPLDLQVPQLLVADVRAAMPRAAVAFFGDPTAELAVAGVTGTNGKTTTAFLLFAVLAAAGRRPGLLGTIECRVGGERRAVQRTTPEAIDLQRTFREMLEAGDRSCAIEASSHASALGRLDGTRFAALVFTNLSQDHLDFHGSMEEYYASKRRLFGTWPAAVNVSGPWGRRLADELRADGGALVTFGFADDADVRPEGLELTPAGAQFRADGLGVTTDLRGRFNVENVLGTIAAARLLGLEDAAVARGIASLRGVPGRFEAVDEGQPFAVIVDYAHTPEALENVLRSARDLASGRLVCVFGCGGDRDRGKRPLMGQAAVALADRVIVTSDNPRSEDPLTIIEEILAGAPGAEVEPDRAAAIERAIELAGEGDVVLIAGKGHEQGQELADRKIPFDDREVAREALRRLGAAA
jgi:UDP-N-acetylmuramoyl-L-alanyl-D-glutamate--2,6-diaminopimelate ligase